MMKTVIIHILLGKANPNRQNGVNRVVHELASYQTYLGYPVEVWGITHKVVNNYGERPFETRLFQDYKSPFRIDRQLKKAINVATKGTIFHLHGAFHPQLYQISQLLKSKGFQYIFTPHGAFNFKAMERSKIRKRIYCFLFERKVVSNAKYIHLIGESEIEGTKSIFGDVPYHLIPNGQALPKENIDEIRFMGHLPVRFGFIGRLDMKTKGLDLLLKGLRKYIDRNNMPVHLNIIGDGPDQKKIIELVERLNLNRYVRFLGPLFGQEKVNQLASLHYLCLTSRNEGLPGVVLEALSTGVPCIVSEETNMGKYIRDSNSGICLSENSPKGICQAIEQAVSAVSLLGYNSQSNNAVRLVKHTFSWEKISQQLIYHFNENPVTVSLS